MADAPVPATPIPATPVAKAEATPAAPPAAAVAEAPSEASPKVTPEAPALVPAVEPPAQSLLGSAVSKEPVAEVKPEPVKPETPAEPAAPEAAPPPELKYEPFKLPENFSRDEKAMGEFTDILKEAKAPQEFGQKLVDLYAREAEKLYESQKKVWSDTVNGWKEDVLADPELGGNRTQTVLRSCGAVLEQFGTPKLREMFNFTGVGNHPEMVRFLDKVGKFLGEGTPVRAEKPVPEVKPSRASRRYGAPQGQT